MTQLIVHIVTPGEGGGGLTKMEKKMETTTYYLGLREGRLSKQVKISYNPYSNPS